MSMIRAKRDARTGRACESGFAGNVEALRFLGKQEGSIEKKRNARSRRQGEADPEPVKTSEARKVIRAADLPPPHRVSDEHFDVICITFKVERSDRQALRQRLDEIADAFLGLERRIAKLLLHRLADEMDQTAALRFSIRISQRSLGELVGGSRERINKILHEWRRSGIIALEHGSIQICDRQALTDLV